MWPFKPRVRIERLMREFYDTHVAGGAVHERRWAGETVDSLFKSIEAVDDNATDVDPDRFREELLAFQAELFGLAWVHRVKKETNVLREAFFTKRYLETAELPELWEAMAAYNAGIAAAVDDSVVEGRAELMGKWVGAGIDQDTARRVSNRLGTGRSWKKGETARGLVQSFERRLGVGLSSAGKERLVEVIKRMYEDARQAIRSVALYA